MKTAIKLWTNVMLLASSSVCYQNGCISPELQDAPSRWLGDDRKCSRGENSENKFAPETVRFGLHKEGRHSLQAAEDTAIYSQILNFNLKCYSCPHCETVSSELLVSCPTSTACVKVSGNGIIVRGCAAPLRNGIVYGCNTVLSVTTCTCRFNGCNGSERIPGSSLTPFLLSCISCILLRK